MTIAQARNFIRIAHYQLALNTLEERIDDAAQAWYPDYSCVPAYARSVAEEALKQGILPSRLAEDLRTAMTEAHENYGVSKETVTASFQAAIEAANSGAEYVSALQAALAQC